VTERSLGLAAMIGACLLWGATPVYFAPLRAVPIADLIAHRVVWSLALFGIILALEGRVGAAFRAIAARATRLRILAAAAMLALNWLMFFAAILNGHVVQASLGYYIYPLAAVLAGTVFFRERLAPVQMLALALAALAVLVLTLGLGVTPWLSLGIAVSFAVYGAVKKGLDLPPRVSVAAEFAVLTPFALAWLAFGPSSPGAPGFGDGAAITILLIGSSVMTAVPLILFTAAARRVELATLGVLQYLNPTLQFLSAVLVFGEPFSRWHLIAFSLIWIAVGLWSVAAFGRRRGLPDARAGL